MESLADVEDFNEEQITALKSIVGTYQDFTTYQKSLLASDALKLYHTLKAKYDELTAKNEEAGKTE